MQGTLDVGWWKRARLSGVLRYHWKTISRTVGWALLIILAAQTLALLAPLVVNVDFTFTGAYANLGIAMVVALVCGVTVSHRSTRFLLRFGTSRLSVWLGNLTALLAGMVAFLLGTLLINLLIGGLTLTMIPAAPGRYQFQEFYDGVTGVALLNRSLQNGLEQLPSYLLYLAEWTCLFYLMGCFLRWNRVLTISVVVGVPLLMVILMLIPAVREAVQVVESADNAQITLLSLQWMKYLMDILEFIQKQWQTIQLVAAVASLPISYLLTRITPQP
jgi:hypothetical protein